MQTWASGCKTPLAAGRQQPVLPPQCRPDGRRPRTRNPWPPCPHIQQHGLNGEQGSCWHRQQHHGRAPAWGAPAPTTQQQQEPALRTLYHASSVSQSGMVPVSDLHSLYYEVHGNPNGVPALFLHGGPGAGCYANHARFFDPDHYKVVLLDQRGCGRSTPRGCLQDNHTAALVADCEALRQQLGIERWGLVLGGSWGVTLALAYAQAHPDRTGSLVLRGICFMRPSELRWMYGGGAAALKPRAWEAFLAHLEPWQRGNPLLGYYGRLLSPVAAVRDAAAHAWMSWEMAVGFGSKGQPLMWDGAEWRSTAAAPSMPPPTPRPVAPAHGATHHQASSFSQVQHGTRAASPSHAPTTASSDRNGRHQAADGSVASASQSPVPWEWGLPGEGANADSPEVQQLLLQGLTYTGGPGAAAQALLECHYSLHGGFLLSAPLLQHMERVRHIPCIAVHGQLDFVCPPANALDLHRAWPEMELHMVPGAGHSMYEPGITHELVQATDRLRGVAKDASDRQWRLQAAAATQPSSNVVSSTRRAGRQQQPAAKNGSPRRWPRN